MSTYHKEQQLQQIEKIMGLPQTEKWRATRDMLRAINPNIRRADDEFILSLNETRADQLNDYGASKSFDIRQLMDMPAYLYEALITVDTALLPMINSKDKQEEKAIWRKLAATFPEYKIARKI